MSISCPHCQKAVPDVLPKHRFDQEAEKRKDAEKRVGELDTENKALAAKAGVADRLSEELTGLKASHATTVEDHGIDMELRKYGSKFDDGDVRKLFTDHWRSQGEDRGEFAAWFAKTAADRDNASGVLRHFLPSVGEDGQPVAPPPAGDQPAGAGAARRPDPGVGGSAPRNGAPGAPPAFKPGEVSNLLAQPGGLARYAEKRLAIGKQLGIDMPDLAESNPYFKRHE